MKSIKYLFGISALISLLFSINAVQADDDDDNDSDRPAYATDQDFYDDGKPADEKVALGKALFFDKILSGNMNISCATCHHPQTDAGDGLSLPVGEGAKGLGASRDTGIGPDAIHERVPRNAPHVFNVGAKEFTRMFFDARVEVNPERASGFDTPAGDDLPLGLDNVLAAQAMFPVTSGTEMAGQPTENSIADATSQNNLAGTDGVWAQLAQRLQDIPAYVHMFKAAYDDIAVADDITFVHAANAIAAFEATFWRADNSPYDQYLRGDKQAMSTRAKRGMALFYNKNKANCSACHSGIFQTDHSFRAIAMPQIGPGKGDGANGHEDFGRGRETGYFSDRFKFRVPSLRNIVLTAPYGHSGAYNSLEAIVRHHLDPVTSLENYDPDQAVLPYREDLHDLDYMVMDDPALRANIAAANELAPVELTDKEVEQLIAFLHALTDYSSLQIRNDVPQSVPSGLPVYD